MVIIGVLYLIFEKKLLTTSKMKGDSTKTADNSLSRSLIGLQIGFIVLAMIVTRSSALSLQAKQGLPRGNQIVGWIVLGKHFTSHPLPLNVLISLSIAIPHALLSPSTAQHPLPSPFNGHLPYFCTPLRNPHHLL